MPQNPAYLIECAFTETQEARIRELIAEYFTNAGRIDRTPPALSYYEYLRDRDEPPSAPPVRPSPNTTERL